MYVNTRIYSRGKRNVNQEIKTVGEMGVSWHMGFVGTLSFSLSANYDFTK